MTERERELRSFVVKVSGGRLLVLLVALGIALACDTDSDSAASNLECRSDADCPGSESCLVSLETEARSLAVVCPTPGPPQPCYETTCFPGQVCTPGGACFPQATCTYDCANADARPCEEGTYCAPGGYCEMIRCDNPLYPGCLTGMTCDPTYVPEGTPIGRYSLVGTDQDTPAGPSDQQIAAALVGCVFLRCDESGGFDCTEGYRCDVEAADPLTTGCFPIPCEELGACSNETFICEPTSSMPRPAVADPHGCVARNCEEGFECSVYSACDFTRAGDGRGCAYLMCDEPGGGCPAGFKCEPDPAPLPSGKTPGPSVTGCIVEHCSIDGAPCRVDGWECMPEDPDSTLDGCVDPTAPASGGAVGSGGASTGGSSPAQGGTAGAASSTTGGSTSGGAPSGGGDSGVVPGGACERDDECREGYCVRQRCAGELGVCR